jgi:cell division protein YceG involved in septum cleavage
MKTKITMNKRFVALALTVVMALAVPAGAWAQSLDEAAAQAARQYNAKVLSARTVQDGKKRVHVIKLLTKDGVVKTVRITVRER